MKGCRLLLEAQKEMIDNKKSVTQDNKHLLNLIDYILNKEYK